ncbi:cell division protein FtsZ [Flavobacteriaceae bacterium F08102]|nr:cell division protein FtsZ [Flavobacteriaceae bacterium F08102]
MEFENLDFDLPKNQSNVIKVIGVGGGGSNAVNHMFKKGINGVDFVVCNTDSQALENSPVTCKIQLGVSLTEGLGAGANPEIGEQAAVESIEEIKKMLSGRAKMVFITVGMGGGTGTGAAPVIAKLAKEMDLLTVGIVTIPFSFEGKMRNDQAQKGIAKLSKHIDSMVVINNNKLREVYGNLGFKAGFSKADEVLSTAAMGIAEVITHHYTQNIDLKDAKTVLSNSGTAIMGSAVATGQNRAQEAITKALDSPLLNDNKIRGAKNVLLLIVSGTTEITIDEIGEINDYIQSEAKGNVDIIMGVGEDEELGESIAVTIVATGFNKDQQVELTNIEAKKIVHSLDSLEAKTPEAPAVPQTPVAPPTPVATKTEETPVIKHTLTEQENQNKDEANFINSLDVLFEEVKVERSQEFTVHPVVNKTEVKQEEVTEQEKQITLSFDLPLTKKTEVPNSPEVRHDLESKNIRDIEVVGAEVVKPVASSEGKITYDLEDKSAPVMMNKRDERDAELDINVRVKEPVAKTKFDDIKDESPLNLTIAELQSRAEERRAKMKDFNYRFINRPSNLDEYDKQPAYKRMGVSLDEVRGSGEEDTDGPSRISLSADDNDEIQLRTNNSFLHDNVD